MLISEALLLLLLEEEKGASVHAGRAHEQGLAGAVLLDLVAAGALEARDSVVARIAGRSGVGPVCLGA
jgi:hypothetical protein